MREIKFRAWSKKNKRWVKPKFNGYICIGYEAIVIIDYKPENNGSYIPDNVNFLTWKEAKDLEIMQYTGLKDKNGKEIYEGDIVQGREYTDCIDEVKFFRGRFGLFGKDGVIHFIAPNFTDYSIMFEVIGNIYENPTERR